MILKDLQDLDLQAFFLDSLLPGEYTGAGKFWRLRIRRSFSPYGPQEKGTQNAHRKVGIFVAAGSRPILHSETFAIN